MNIEMSIASSARMSIRPKTGHPNETSTEAEIETSHAETPIDIVMTTRTHPLGAMMDFSRPRGTAIMRVGSMVESTFGWCSDIDGVGGLVALLMHALPLSGTPGETLNDDTIIPLGPIERTG